MSDVNFDTWGSTDRFFVTLSSAVAVDGDATTDVLAEQGEQVSV